MRPQAVDFRADINGLRAIAVIAVMLFHFGISGFSGGFVGVDVFFVISGYLMTRIILGPLAGARFSLMRFYFARARRIFPALAVVCLLLLLYGWFHLSPMDFKQLAKHAGTSLLFVSNQTYMKESGYFDADAHEKWLLHTWSLSVEWQFYLAYPLLILAAHQLFRWRAGMAGFLWAVFIASLTWSAWLAFANPAKAFFMLPTRAWEMLAGGLIFMHQGACNRLTQGRRWPEAAGIAAILAACLLLGSDNPWPGLLALLPVAGAMLIIANSSGKTRFLGGAAIQGIGRWSYSIYLWHWPIVVWLHQSQSQRNAASIAAGMAASIALGWISFRLVELPARSFAGRLKLAPGLAACAGMVLLPFAAAAALHYQTDRITQLRFKDHPRLAEVNSLMAVEALYSRERYKTLYREGTCLLELSISHEGFSPECTGERPRMVLWGDSHAAHLWPGLSKAVAPGSAAQWTASGCPPLMHVDIPKARHCREINEWVLKAVKEMRPEVVILAGAWFRPDDATIRQGLAETLSALAADPGWQPQVVVVGSVPIWHKTLPRILASDLLGGDESTYSRNGLDQEAFRKDRLIRTLVGTQATFFSPIDAVCGDSGCLRYFSKDNAIIPLAYDYGHLTVEGSTLITANMLQHVRNKHLFSAASQ